MVKTIRTPILSFLKGSLVTSDVSASRDKKVRNERQFKKLYATRCPFDSNGVFDSFLLAAVTN